LDERLKSPLPQYIVTGLEGISWGDIDYPQDIQIQIKLFLMISRSKQAFNLIQDIDFWGNMDNFEGTVDQHIIFLENHLGQMSC